MSASFRKFPLHAIAHGRAGDKGNHSNISVIAYEARAWPILQSQVTEARVLECFRPLGATRVTRYELPHLHALNFVIENTLDGGVNQSRNLDRHGKTLAFRLLGRVLVELDPEHLPQGSPYRDPAFSWKNPLEYF
ncbi:MAG: hypothetical protein VX610_01790 [SAR324 cluster bacterium]|nr:hypothetical protein [SAR324 cluster bacterium]